MDPFPDLVGFPPPRQLAEELLARDWAHDTLERKRLLLEAAARTITALIARPPAAGDRPRPVAVAALFKGLAGGLAAGDRDIEHAVDQAVAALVAWTSWSRGLRIAYPREFSRMARRTASKVIDLIHMARATGTKH